MKASRRRAFHRPPHGCITRTERAARGAQPVLLNCSPPNLPPHPLQRIRSFAHLMQLSAALPLALALCARHAHALANVTIDDQSPLISYAPAGSWARINDSSTATLDIDGGHMLTSDPAATAVLNFTGVSFSAFSLLGWAYLTCLVGFGWFSGVAVYFYSARWPYNVSSAVALDSGAAVLLDLTDHTRATTDGGPATVKAAVVGAAVGLTNTTHTLTVSVGAGQPFAVVDAIMYAISSPLEGSVNSVYLRYTALGPHDSLPASSTNSTPPTQLTPVPPASTSTAHKSHTSRALTIALPHRLHPSPHPPSHPTLPLAPAARFPPYDHNNDHRIPLPRGRAQPARRRAHDAQCLRHGRDGRGGEGGLRITNPDPAASPASLVGPAPPVIAMPTPSARASAAPRHDPGADGNSDGDKQSALRSPGTYYNTLRAMTHSPGRAYPVPPPPPAHGGGPGAGEGAHQRWDSTATSADADMYAEDSRPASRSVYSQVTAIGLEEGEVGGRSSACTTQDATAPPGARRGTRTQRRTQALPAGQEGAEGARGTTCRLRMCLCSKSDFFSFARTRGCRVGSARIIGE